MSAWRLLLVVYGIVAVVAASVLGFLRDLPFDHPSPWLTLGAATVSYTHLTLPTSDLV